MEPAFLIGIPPVFEGAHGIVIAIFVRPGMGRGLAESGGQRISMTLKVFDEVQRPETSQCLSLSWSIVIFIWFVHRRALCRRFPHWPITPLCGKPVSAGSPGGGPPRLRNKSPQPERVGQGSRQR